MRLQTNKACSRIVRSGFLALIVDFCGAASATEYYIGASGDDANPGTSPGQAWGTVNRVNAADFGAGDRVLFEGGATFPGMIAFDANDSGASGSPLEVGSYGAGRATIDGGNGLGMYTSGCDHLLVHDLDFVGSGRHTNTNYGVYFHDGQNVQADHLDASGFRESGLHVDACDDVRITHVYAHDNGFAGITSGWSTWSSDLYIGYCVAENNPGHPTNLTDNHSGNGILVGAARDVVIEYCEALRNGWDMPRMGNGPVGIWAYWADNVLIQYCISHHNQSPSLDGGGFDFDGGVTNSILQYNFSHDNDGAGYGLFQYGGAEPWTNNVIRYNISQNDGIRNGQCGIAVWSAEAGMSGARIHNNTIYNNLPGGHAVLFISGPWSDFNFWNNTFISSGSQIEGGSASASFKGNFYWGPAFSVDGYGSFDAWAAATGQEKMGDEVVGRYADPRVASPGTAALTDPIQLASLVEYQLMDDSPAINTGLDLTARFGANPGPHDFYGNPLPLGPAYDVGVHESVVGDPDVPAVPFTCVAIVALILACGATGMAFARSSR